MTILASLRPVLRGSASVTLTLTAAPNDALDVLVTSKLAVVDPDTADAARAALQAALALPLRLTIPAGSDPDAVFAAALTRYDTARAPVMDDLQALLDALAQAQQAAKASAKKPAAPAKPAATKATKSAGQGAAQPAPAPAAAATAADNDGEPDAHATDEAETTPATTATPSGQAPASQAASTLFDF